MFPSFFSDIAPRGFAVLMLCIEVWAVLFFTARLFPNFVHKVFCIVHKVVSPRHHLGKHVAEVWLEWPVCRGSTMFRHQFRTRRGAVLAARIYAFMLDQALPTHYASTDYLGRPCRESYDYGIYWGVRSLADNEETCCQEIWTVDMPGTKSHRGEHSMAHPWNKPASPEELGFKV